MAVRMCRKNAWSRTGRYFKRCEEKGERLTLSGLAMALAVRLPSLSRPILSRRRPEGL